MLMSDIKIFFDRLFLPLPKAAMNEPFKLLAFSRVANHNRHCNSLLFISPNVLSL